MIGKSFTIHFKKLPLWNFKEGKKKKKMIKIGNWIWCEKKTRFFFFWPHDSRSGLTQQSWFSLLNASKARTDGKWQGPGLDSPAVNDQRLWLSDYREWMYYLKDNLQWKQRGKKETKMKKKQFLLGYVLKLFFFWPQMFSWAGRTWRILHIYFFNLDNHQDRTDLWLLSERHCFLQYLYGTLFPLWQ